MQAPVSFFGKGGHRCAQVLGMLVALKCHTLNNSSSLLAAHAGRQAPPPAPGPAVASGDHAERQ